MSQRAEKKGSKKGQGSGQVDGVQKEEGEKCSRQKGAAYEFTVLLCTHALDNAHTMPRKFTDEADRWRRA